MNKSRKKAAVHKLTPESKKDLDDLEALVVEIQGLDSQKTKLLKSFKKNLSAFTKKFCKDASEKIIFENIYISGLEIKIEHENFIDIHIDLQGFGDYYERVSDSLLLSEQADREDFCNYFESKKDAKALIATFQQFVNLCSYYLYDAFGESVVEINKNGQIKHYPG